MRALISALLPCAATLAAGTVSAQDRLLVTLEGDASGFAVLGDLGDKLDEDGRTDDGFRVKLDLDVVARREDREHGLRYGSITNFETDIDSDGYETQPFIFIEGSLGEARFGVDDAAGISLRQGVAEIAVGTGGLDGELIDSPDLVTPALLDTDDIRAIAYSSEHRRLQAGASFTPGEDDFDDIAEAVLTWRGIDDGRGIAGSLGGAVAKDDNSALLIGLILAAEPWQLALGSGLETLPDEADRHFSNAGIAWKGDDVAVSLTGGWCHDCGEHENWNFVAGAEMEPRDGVVLSAELSWFDEDKGNDSSGVISLLTLKLEF